MGPRARRLIVAAQRACFWFARHWLALANGFNLAVLAGSAAVPALAAAGLHGLAEPVFASYLLVCHQLPYRSFFLFGQQMAMCQRDVAIYASMALAGILFALDRDRWSPLAWRWYLLALLPIGIDGTTQLLGFRESNWELRLATGTIFGVATVWLAYPYLERFAADILSTETRGLGEALTRRPAISAQGPGRGAQDVQNRKAT
ncbi:MAG: DUF2085 domain-containing protein [Sphingomonadaceae bacterium]